MAHAQLGGVARHAFVHVFVQALVEGEQGLEPRVGHFVHRHPDEAAQASVPGDGGHGVSMPPSPP